VDFRWWAGADAGGHVEAAVEALMAAIDNPSRRWNPYNQSITRSEFRKRIQLAASGLAKPVDHVKDIGNDPIVPMFELRWDREIRVTEIDERGRQTFRTIKVRLLHAEPAQFGLCAVGLHAHEKLIFPDDRQRTRAMQDAEIEVAVERYNSGYASRWGFPDW
jgi:hypothetical protein